MYIRLYIAAPQSKTAVCDILAISGFLHEKAYNYVLWNGKNDFCKIFFKKGIFRKKQFDKVKCSMCKNASTARYHQLQGKKISGRLKIILIRII